MIYVHPHSWLENFSTMSGAQFQNERPRFRAYMLHSSLAPFLQAERKKTGQCRFAWKFILKCRILPVKYSCSSKTSVNIFYVHDGSLCHRKTPAGKIFCSHRVPVSLINHLGTCFIRCVFHQKFKDLQPFKPLLMVLTIRFTLYFSRSYIHTTSELNTLRDRLKRFGTNPALQFNPFRIDRLPFQKWQLHCSVKLPCMIRACMIYISSFIGSICVLGLTGARLVRSASSSFLKKMFHNKCWICMREIRSNIRKPASSSTRNHVYPPKNSGHHQLLDGQHMWTKMNQTIHSIRGSIRAKI